jgi:hypothetical protein
LTLRRILGDLGKTVVKWCQDLGSTGIFLSKGPAPLGRFLPAKQRSRHRIPAHGKGKTNLCTPGRSKSLLPNSLVFNMIFTVAKVDGEPTPHCLAWSKARMRGQESTRIWKGREGLEYILWFSDFAPPSNLPSPFSSFPFPPYFSHFTTITHHYYNHI